MSVLIVFIILLSVILPFILFIEHMSVVVDVAVTTAPYHHDSEHRVFSLSQNAYIDI